MTKYYRFDQLFEKLPNGSYRERETPAPMLGIDHRHDFFRSPTTGRICVLYPAMSWDDLVRYGHAIITDDPTPPLLGGNWGHGTLIYDPSRQINWNFGPTLASWNS